MFLPGTDRAADRFARASFLLDAIPRQLDPLFPGEAAEQFTAAPSFALLPALMPAE